MAVSRARLASVRFRVTALATAVVIVVLSLGAVALVLAQRSQITSNLDQALVQRADDLEAVLSDGGLPNSFGGEGPKAFAQLIDPSGKVLVSSQALDHPIWSPPLPAVQLFETRADLEIDDDRYRILVRTVDLPTGPAALVVAGSLDEVSEPVSFLAGALAATVPLVSVAMAALVWFLVGRTLAPVEAIRAEVADIEASRLSRRVPVPPVDDEVARLAITMNQMLERLDRAAARQKRFVADASHELRTPLARIRSEAEVDLAISGSDHLRATVESIRDETLALQRLIDDLLYLARADEGAVTPRQESIDLDVLVSQEVGGAKSTSRVRIDTQAVSAGVVKGDAAQIGRVVRNLLENAIRHATSAVAVSVRETDDAVVLIVDDDGPGVPIDQREAVFDRFIRLDGARSRAEGGIGLGLSISRDILQRHGATIAAESNPGGGARFRVTFPAVG